MHNPDVQVDVVAQYLANESIPEKHRYVFSYTVTIHNHSPQAVKLLTRHWIITNGETLKTQEVHGDGVVGKQPIIAAGQSYTYNSGSVMESAVGSMQGSYRMIDEDGEYFDALIAPFTLAATGSLH